MISELYLYHFKCFKELYLPLKPLTLLSGSNASGKSSVLQSLVLLHQTMHDHEWSRKLLLNGREVRLGTVQDVVNKIEGRKGFGVGLKDSMDTFKWAFMGDREEMAMEIKGVNLNGNAHDHPEKLHFLAPEVEDGRPISGVIETINNLTYITAERYGPREFYALEDEQEAYSVGRSGEHAVGLLYLGRDEPVLPEIVIEDVPPNRMRQVEAQMQRFFPGCGITVDKVPRVNAVTLGIRTSETTDYHRPIHVGFGLTQVFPIIVAALSAKEGDLILIENPEVHLHPAGQALMGQFLAEVSAAGVQIVLETHSDHILNGIRRSVKSKKVQHEGVAIYFFRSYSDERGQVQSPQIDADGNLDDWPEDFFDQFDKDMDFFAGWGS